MMTLMPTSMMYTQVELDRLILLVQLKGDEDDDPNNDDDEPPSSFTSPSFSLFLSYIPFYHSR